MSKKKVRKEEAKKVANKIQEALELTEVEGLIQDNKVPFTHKEQKYRVRLPTRKERREAQRFQAIKYDELLSTPGYKLREEWVQAYAEKGIDVEKMDDEVRDIEEKINELYIDINETTDEEAKKKFKDQILDYRAEKKLIDDKKFELLQYCIEDQISEDGNLYILYLILEKEMENKWERVFKDFEEVLNTQEEDLLIMATAYLAHLYYETRL